MPDDKANSAEIEEDKDKKEERQKKAYIDDDLKAPFEISWDGAPEFQWKSEFRDRLPKCCSNPFFSIKWSY